MGRAYILLLIITSSCGLQEKRVVYLFSLLVSVLLQPLCLYYSLSSSSFLPSHTLAGGAAGAGTWSDCNHASDPSFPSVSQ